MGSPTRLPGTGGLEIADLRDRGLATECFPYTTGYDDSYDHRYPEWDLVHGSGFGYGFNLDFENGYARFWYWYFYFYDFYNGWRVNRRVDAYFHSVSVALFPFIPMLVFIALISSDGGLLVL